MLAVAMLSDRAGRAAKQQGKPHYRCLTRRQASAKLSFKCIEKATGHVGIVAAAMAIIVSQDRIMERGLHPWKRGGRIIKAAST